MFRKDSFPNLPNLPTYLYLIYHRISRSVQHVDSYKLKVYGPHIAQMYVRRALHPRIHSLGHFFQILNTLEARFGLAAASYELVSALPSVVEYFGSDPAQIWAAMAAHEAKIGAILLEYLRGEERVTLFGEPSADSAKRVPTISFVVRGMGAKAVVNDVESQSRFGCRAGHMYAKRLVEEVLGQGEEGVVRVSLVHYNTGKPTRTEKRVH